MFYLNLFRKLQQFDVQYLLIGGLAVSLHGVERAIDLSDVAHLNKIKSL